MQSLPAVINRQALWALVLVLLTVVQGCIFAFAIPPWQAPDEPAHFELVQMIARAGRMVTPADRGPSGTLAPNIVESLDRNGFFRFVPWADRWRVLQ